jgi:hypothetical protein
MQMTGVKAQAMAFNQVALDRPSGAAESSRQ